MANSGLGRTTYLVDTATGEVRDLEHPGDRRRAVLAPARRAPTHVHPGLPCGRKQPILVPSAGGVRHRDARARIPSSTSARAAGRRMGRTSSSTATTRNRPRMDRTAGSRDRNDEPTRGRVRPSLERREAAWSGTACFRGTPTGPLRDARLGRHVRPDCRPHASHPNSTTLRACNGRPTTAGSSSYPQDENIGWVLLDPEGGPAITPVWSERGVETLAALGALTSPRNPPETSERIGG